MGKQIYLKVYSATGVVRKADAKTTECKKQVVKTKVLDHGNIN